MRLPSGGEGYGSLAEVKTALGDMGVGGIQSTPPTGSFQIMNLYVDEVGRLVVEYEDGV